MSEWVDTYQDTNDILNINITGYPHRLNNLLRRGGLQFTTLREVVEFGIMNYLATPGIARVLYERIKEQVQYLYGVGYLME